MPDMTGFLCFVSLSAIVSLVFMHGGAAEWLVKNLAHIIRPL